MLVTVQRNRPVVVPDRDKTTGEASLGRGDGGLALALGRELVHVGAAELSIVAIRSAEMPCGTSGKRLRSCAFPPSKVELPGVCT